MNAFHVLSSSKQVQHCQGRIKVNNRYIELFRQCIDFWMYWLTLLFHSAVIRVIEKMFHFCAKAYFKLGISFYVCSQ